MFRVGILGESVNSSELQLSSLLIFCKQAYFMVPRQFIAIILYLYFWIFLMLT